MLFKLVYSLHSLDAILSRDDLVHRFACYTLSSPRSVALGWRAAARADEPGDRELGGILTGIVKVLAVVPVPS